MVTSVTTDYSKLTAVAPKTDATTATAKKSIDGALSQAQFLKLMTTQMTHQDPSKPMQNGEFLTQMAQFGTVSGIQDLQKSFSDFAGSVGSGQALQAANLVNHTVSAPATQVSLANSESKPGEMEPIKVEFELTGDATDLTVQLTNSKTGVLVDTLHLGKQTKGTVSHEWDGKGSNGELLDPGVYKVAATATIDGKDTAMVTNVQSVVKSVTMGGGSAGVMLNLASGESVNFNKVKQIL